MHDLAERLAAHPRWRWIEGARTRDGEAVIFAFSGTLTLATTRGEVRRAPAEGLVPDLSAPGTRGALTHLLQETADAWSLNRHRPAGWTVTASAAGGSYATREPAMDLGEVLARTLLALWAR